MSSLVLADSCMWIDATRHKGATDTKLAVKGLLDEFAAVLCGPVELEVLGGVRKEERSKLKEYFDILPYRASDHKIWRQAAETSWKLRDHGLNCPWNDCVIATIALEHNYRIYSQDKHFKAMAELLPIQLYTPGYMGMYNPS